MRPIFEDHLFAFLQQHHLKDVCMLPSTHSYQVVAQKTNKLLTPVSKNSLYNDTSIYNEDK